MWPDVHQKKGNNLPQQRGAELEYVEYPGSSSILKYRIKAGQVSDLKKEWHRLM